MKVLIVDDSPMIRGAISAYLNENKSATGYTVIGQASNGLDALTIFREYEPEIVTMDITMPEMDGLACLQEIIKINSETKTIVVTALSDKATGLRAIELGASAFVLKPFTKKDILDAIVRVSEGN